MKNVVKLSCLLLLLAACGGEAAEVSVSDEQPGDNCPEGGVVVTVDGEDFYACDGEDGEDGHDGESPTISTEEVAADDPDNPCEYEATLVTVESTDGTVTEEYFCEAEQPEVSSEAFVAYIEAAASGVVADAENECECNFDSLGYESIEECLDEESLPYSEQRFLVWCYDEGFREYGKEAPQSFDEARECSKTAIEDREACWDLLDDEDMCSQEGWDDAMACQSDAVEDFANCFGDMNDEAEEYNADLINFLDYYCGERPMLTF